jgi:hypothetical protein
VLTVSVRTGLNYNLSLYFFDRSTRPARNRRRVVPADSGVIVTVQKSAPNHVRGVPRIVDVNRSETQGRGADAVDIAIVHL